MDNLTKKTELTKSHEVQFFFFNKIVIETNQINKEILTNKFYNFSSYLIIDKEDTKLMIATQKSLKPKTIEFLNILQVKENCGMHSSRKPFPHIMFLRLLLIFQKNN